MARKNRRSMAPAPLQGIRGDEGRDERRETPLLNERPVLDLAPDEVNEEAALERVAPEQVNIGRRLSDWRTLASFGVALAVLLFAVKKAGIDWGAARLTLTHANLWLFALAFVVYYLSFPLRGYRWRRLLRNANSGAMREKIDRIAIWDLTEIVYLSYFANAVVPAKLGDVYRAYLARRWTGVSMSRTVGNILAERILDLMALFPLLLAAAALTFRGALFSAHGSTIRLALVVGLLLAMAAGGFLVAIWWAGERVVRLLPRRAHGAYLHFRDGAVRSFGRDAPMLVGQTIIIWLLEGARFACILAALGLLSINGPGIGLPAALFLALGSSVLTTLPLTPAGLGLVEPFIFTVLAVLGVHGGITTGAAVAVLERIVSYLSIAVFGFILYIISDKTRPTATPAAREAALARPA